MLTYAEYVILGGTATEAAFNDHIDEAEAYITRYPVARDYYATSTPPSCVLRAIKRIVDICISAVDSDQRETSVSESVDGESKSVSYAVSTPADTAQKCDILAAGALRGKTDGDGHPLTFLGVC